MTDGLSIFFTVFFGIQLTKWVYSSTQPIPSIVSLFFCLSFYFYFFPSLRSKRDIDDRTIEEKSEKCKETEREKKKEKKKKETKGKRSKDNRKKERRKKERKKAKERDKKKGK